MAEHLGEAGEGGKRTPEEEAEGILGVKFADGPLTPEEIERLFRKLKNEGIEPNIGQVVRKVLKRMVATGLSADREIASLIVFCKLHNIPYEEDYSAEKLYEMERFYNHQVESWMKLLSKK